MLFTTPEQFVVLAGLLLGGLLIGYACAPSPRKWKRRVREQSESFTEHYAALDEQLRATRQRAADLETQASRLRTDHAEAERTIGALRAAAMPAPVALAAELAHRPALTVVPEPEPVATPEPVTEAEWTPVEAEPQPVSAEAGAAIDKMAEVPLHEPVAEAPIATIPTHTAEEASDETRNGAPATGDTFPVEDSVASRKAAAPLPADPASTEEAVLTEPVVERREPLAEVPMTPVATDAPPAPIGPAETEMPSKGWFASSARDDLTRIRGIDGVLNTRLFSLGVVRFEDLEKMSAEDEMALEQRLALPVGYIAREQWRTQSALLRAGQTEEHAKHFGAEPVTAY